MSVLFQDAHEVTSILEAFKKKHANGKLELGLQVKGDSFVPTLTNLWKTRQKGDDVLSRLVIKRKDNIYDVTTVRLDKDVIKPTRTVQYMTTAFGELAMSSGGVGHSHVIVEGDYSHVRYDEIMSSIRVSFDMDSTWRVNVSIRSTHDAKTKVGLVKALRSFQYNPVWRDIDTAAAFVKMLQNLYTTLDNMSANISLVYSAEPKAQAEPEANGKTINFLLREIEKNVYVAYTSCKPDFAKVSLNHLVRDNPWREKHGLDKSDLVPFATGISEISHLVTLKSATKEKYDGKIVACSWSGPDTGWTPISVARGAAAAAAAAEDYDTAYTAFTAILSSIEDLAGRKQYFEEIPPQVKKDHADMLFVNRLFKAIIYEKYMMPGLSAIDTIIEVGGGRGGDMLRTFFAGARNYYVIDPDIDALIEYEVRLKEWLREDERSRTNNAMANVISGRKVLSGSPHVNLRLLHHAMGPEEGATDKLIDSIVSDTNYPKTNVNVVSMQFAIHYLFGSKESLSSLHQLCDKTLNKKGRLVFTYLDGDAIYDLLSKNIPNNGKMEVKGGKAVFYMQSGKAIKYAIHKLYTKKELFGMKVKVLLRTISSEMKEEYLVTKDGLMSVFDDYKIIQDKYMLDMDDMATTYAKFRKIKPARLTDMMLENDVNYLRYIKVTILEKQ